MLDMHGTYGQVNSRCANGSGEVVQAAHSTKYVSYWLHIAIQSEFALKKRKLCTKGTINLSPYGCNVICISPETFTIFVDRNGHVGPVKRHFS